MPRQPLLLKDTPVTHLSGKHPALDSRQPAVVESAA